MRTVIALLLLGLSMSSAAECVRVEFAELSAKTKAQLDAYFCESMRAATDAKRKSDDFMDLDQKASDAGMLRMAAGYRSEASNAMKEFERCAGEGQRAWDILIKRKLNRPKCPYPLWMDGAK